MNPRWLYPFQFVGAPAHAAGLGSVPENPVYLYAVRSSPGWVATASPPSPRMLSENAAVFDAPSVRSVTRTPNWTGNAPSAPIGDPYPPPLTPDPWLAT